MATTLARFTQSACPVLGRCVRSPALRRVPSMRSRQGAGSLPCSTVKDSGWEPDGVTLQVRFCEGPGTSRRMAEILWHRRETRRQQRTRTSVYTTVRTRPTLRLLNSLRLQVSSSAEQGVRGNRGRTTVIAIGDESASPASERSAWGRRIPDPMSAPTPRRAGCANGERLRDKCRGDFSRPWVGATEVAATPTRSCGKPGTYHGHRDRRRIDLACFRAICLGPAHPRSDVGADASPCPARQRGAVAGQGSVDVNSGGTS